MNIYLISQKENIGYETYDSAIVYAKSEDDAKKMSPYDGSKHCFDKNKYFSTWCSSLENVNVELLGVAKNGAKKGLILSSFSAG